MFRLSRWKSRFIYDALFASRKNTKIQMSLKSGDNQENKRLFFVLIKVLLANVVEKRRLIYSYKKCVYETIHLF